jgi:GT2 family glycosyltransferase
MPTKKTVQKNNLAIIIVSYNTRQLLDNCLTSIYKALHPQGGLEVVVVDNNSKDGSLEMVKKKFPQVQLIENTSNLGFSKANNIGAKATSSKYLLFLNSDTVLKKFSLVKPLKYLKNHTKVGALTIKLILGSGEIDYDNRRGFPTPWNTFCRLFGLSKIFTNSLVFNSYHLGFRPIKKPTQVPVIAGSFFMISSKVFKEIAGWDEDFFFYGEDIDICYRLQQAGYQIIYYPRTSAIHLKGASSGIRIETEEITKATKKIKIKVAKASIKAWELFVKKHYSNKYPTIFVWFMMLGIKIKGSIRLLKWKLS